jgi:hypothetical protein
MKARQLLLYKAEAKQTVSSTRCGPALTLLKMRSIQRPYHYCYTKRRKKQTVSSTCCGPALTDFKSEFKMKAAKCNLTKRWHSGNHKKICIASAVTPLRQFQALDGATIRKHYSMVLFWQHVRYIGS